MDRATPRKWATNWRAGSRRRDEAWCSPAKSIPGCAANACSSVAVQIQCWHCKDARGHHLVTARQLTRAWILKRAFHLGRCVYRESRQQAAARRPHIPRRAASICRNLATELARIASARLSADARGVFEARWQLNLWFGLSLRGARLAVRTPARSGVAAARDHRRRQRRRDDGGAGDPPGASRRIGADVPRRTGSRHCPGTQSLPRLPLDLAAGVGGARVEHRHAVLVAARAGQSARAGGAAAVGPLHLAPAPEQRLSSASAGSSQLMAGSGVWISATIHRLTARRLTPSCASSRCSRPAGTRPGGPGGCRGRGLC